MRARDGQWLMAAGLVLVRQRPGSAKGVMFITIEDETGVANIVVWPKLFERSRRVVLGASMMAINGRIQREGDVVHLVAQQLFDLSADLSSLTERDAAFRPPTGRGDEFAHWFTRKSGFPRTTGAGASGKRYVRAGSSYRYAEDQKPEFSVMPKAGDSVCGSNPIKACRLSIFLFANDLVAAWSADDRCSVTVFANKASPAFNAVGGQSAAFDSCLNHAARFMRMGTIAKSAKRCQFRYVGKKRVDPVGDIADVECSYPWRIYDPAAARNCMQRSRGRGVTALRVIFANCPGFLL